MQKAIQKSPNLNSKVHNRLPPTQHLSTQSQGVSSQSHCRFHVTFWNQPITGQRFTSHPLNQPITDQKNQQPITSDFTYIKINQSQVSQMRYSTNHWSHIRYHSANLITTHSVSPFQIILISHQKEKQCLLWGDVSWNIWLFHQEIKRKK